MIEIDKWQGEDISFIVQLWVDECEIGGFDMETAKEDVRALAEGNNSAVFVLKVNDLIVGGLGIGILDMFFTQECYSAVRYWYIEPDYRYLAKKLLNHARKWSQDMGCKQIMVCSNKLCHPADEFYLSMGFREFETVYIGDL